MITLLSTLRSLSESLAYSISTIQKRIEKYPPGRLVSYCEKGIYRRYKILIPGKLPVNVSKKDQYTLVRMTRKRMFEAQLSQQKSDLAIVNALIDDLKNDAHPYEILRNDPGLHEVMQRYGLFEENDEWSRADYQRNMSHPEHLTIPTEAGYPVRSKSEYMILSILLELGIPFRYEAAFLLNDGTIIYPDFTIKHPETGEIFIVEHFGMMDDDAYREKAWKKIRIYDEHGYRPDKNLIIFYEYRDKPLNPMRVRNTFKDLILV